eukprot:m.22543 g.22543  ORF g.22543 m.22543 type:complete len:430 (+) comp3766_c0_seq2:545-1834(+)
MRRHIFPELGVAGELRAQITSLSAPAQMTHTLSMVFSLLVAIFCCQHSCARPPHSPAREFLPRACGRLFCRWSHAHSRRISLCMRQTVSSPDSHSRLPLSHSFSHTLSHLCIFNRSSALSHQLIQLLILGNTAPDLLADISDTKYFTRSYVLVGFVLAASPICFFKSVGRLAIPSLLNQIFVMTALSIVLYKTIEAATQNPLNKDVMEKTSFLGVLSAVGGLSYFYVCQDMAVQVMHALKRSTGRRWAIVSWTVPGLLMVMVVLLGLIGSLYLPDSSDLLSAIGSGIPAKIARGCIVGAIFCAVPYNTYMPRVAILGVLKDFIPTWTVKDKRDPGHNRFKRNVVHVTITVSLIGSALLLAEFVDDLGLVLEFVGAVSGVGIGLILPPLCYIAQSPYHWSHPENHLVLAVLIIGVASMGGCVASLLISNT